MLEEVGEYPRVMESSNWQATPTSGEEHDKMVSPIPLAAMCQQHAFLVAIFL